MMSNRPVRRWLGWLLGILVLVDHPVAAQHGDPFLTGYTLTSWTDANGIPLGAVYAISQDADGYLWVGTDTGLLRFDGLRFSAWPLTGEPSPRIVHVSAIYSAPDRVWVGTSDGGVYEIRGERVRQVGAKTTLGPVASIVADRAGAIVVVTETAVFRLHGDKWTTLNGLPAAGIVSAYLARDGRLLVGTTSGAYEELEEGLGFRQVLQGWTFAISEDRFGRTWTTDIRTGFRRVGDVTDLPPRGNGYRMIHDRQGDFWVATIGTGLWRVRALERTPVVQRVPGLLTDSVESLFEDRDGNVWAGTTTGLHRLTPQKLTPVDVGFVVATEHSGESTWAATWRGLIELSEQHGAWTGELRSPADWFVRTVYRDRAGTLWLGSNLGLGSIVDGRVKTRTIAGPAAGLGINAITSDSKGHLWVANGVQLFEVVRDRLVPYDLRAVGDVGKIASVYGDSSGRVWVVVNDGARLVVIDENRSCRIWESGTPELAVPNGATIRAVLQDHAGTIWIGHDRGLTMWNGKRSATINSTNGLPGDRVWSLVEDTDDSLWLSVDLGVVRVPRAEIAKNIADPSHRIRYELFDASDGLAGAPLRNVRASRAADGTLWFVRGGGLTVVDPRALKRTLREKPSPVRIETVLNGEQSFLPRAGMALPGELKRLQIRYAAVTLTSPTKVLFRYRLDGFDSAWVNVDTRREAVYTNLAPGDYVFRVEAVSMDGTWAQSTATWPFRVSPKFYQTTQFYAAAIALMLLTLIGTWRLRLRFVRNQFSLALAERVRLSQEIHDTLLQSLMALALQFDDLYHSVSPVPDAIRTRLVRARQLIQGHIREARNSIAELRSPTLNIENLSESLRTFALDATADAPTAVAFSSEGDQSRRGPDVGVQLFRIGREAIINAVRHAGANRIDVSLIYRQDEIVLSVVDDGRGFDIDEDHSHSSEHFGLATMRERAEQIGGAVRITTGPGRGTRVEARVPQTGG